MVKGDRNGTVVVSRLSFRGCRFAVGFAVGVSRLVSFGVSRLAFRGWHFAVGGLRGWRFARLAVCVVGRLRGWPFARLAVCAVGGLRGWRFAW